MIAGSRVPPCPPEASKIGGRRVAIAAGAAAGANAPVTEDVDVRITYFFVGGAADVDNIVKPILDGMCRVVHDDDSGVIDVRSGKRNLDGSFRVKGMSQPLADGFVSGSDFVHVRVVFPGDQTELP